MAKTAEKKNESVKKVKKTQESAKEVKKEPESKRAPKKQVEKPVFIQLPVLSVEDKPVFEQISKTPITLTAIANRFHATKEMMEQWCIDTYGKTFANAVYSLRVDREQFEKLCALQCSESEIADFFHVPPNFITEWCGEMYEQNFENSFREFSAPGKIRLRRIQFQLAEKNAAMAIFLGKVVLGQREDAPPQDEGTVKRINQQSIAIAELINNPVPERTLAEVDSYVPTQDEANDTMQIPGLGDGV